MELGIDKCTKIVLKRGKLVDRQKCDDLRQLRNTRAEQERTCKCPSTEEREALIRQ